MTSLLSYKAQPKLRYVSLEDHFCLYNDAGQMNAGLEVQFGHILVDMGKEYFIEGVRYRKVKLTAATTDGDYGVGYIKFNNGDAKFAVLL